MKEKVSLAVVRRLPRYYRYLGELQRQGVDKISSGGLAEKMGLTASQIRQDLNCFGGFGQQGYGYNVEMLRGEIASILGLPRQYRTVLIGVGNLGRALVSHVGFEKRGFSLIGLFDVREDVIGTSIGAHTVLPMSELEAFCLRERPEAAVLSLPRAAAPEVADRLVELLKRRDCGGGDPGGERPPGGQSDDPLLSDSERREPEIGRRTARRGEAAHILRRNGDSDETG